MNLRAVALAVAILSTQSGLALAQTTSGNAAASASSPTAATPQNGTRRDPANRTGISPSWEAIKRGDDAYVARNLEGAIHEYQAAIEAQQQNPVAHYRLACALVAKGDLKLAQESLDSALRFSQSDAQTAVKVLFVTADLKERQHDYPAAIAAWKVYSAFIAAHPGIKAFAHSSESRQTKLTEYSKLTEQSAKVKQRIEERQQLMESDAEKNAKGSKK